MALNKEASFGYRRMVEAEQAWAASFRDAEVYEMGPEREHYGERLPCRRRVILARDSEIPDMSGMMAARDYYADVMGVIESGKLKTSGPGSRGASSVMRYAPGAPGNRAPLLQDDDIMRHPVTEVVHTETEAYRGGPKSIDQLLEMIGGKDPARAIEIDGKTHWLYRDEDGRAVGPEGLIFRESSGTAHRLSLRGETGYRHQARVATILVVGARSDVTVSMASSRSRRSKYEVEYRAVGQVTIGLKDKRELTAYLRR